MPNLLCVLQGVPIYQYPDDANKVIFTADADIDADGCNGQAGEWAYKKGNKGLEDLANAGYPNTPYWRDILVSDAKGPIIFPGGGIASRTAYEHRNAPPNSPERYVDSFTVPYTVVSPTIRKRAKGVILGCLCRITNRNNGKTVLTVVADIGPVKKIGEISMAAAKAIGLPWNPRTGGTSDRIVKYELFPGVRAEINGFKYDLIPA